MVVHACNLSTWKAEAGESEVPASLEHTVRPTLKKLTTTSVVRTMFYLSEWEQLLHTAQESKIHKAKSPLKYECFFFLDIS